MNNRQGKSRRASLVKRTWTEKYRIVDTLKGGAQGQLFVVVRIGDKDQKKLVLKVPRDQGGFQARARMKQEIESLRKLSSEGHHPGVVKLTDDNAEMSNRLDIELYMVAEYVDGNTLDLVAPVETLEVALAIVLELVDALIFCHSNKVIHRDIKPLNIKLTKDDQPVLLDFGLSLDQALVGNITEVGETIGNKFLQLPEFKLRQNIAEDKRDARSDVCLCVAILFYLLTKIDPEQLLDQEERPPHRRKGAIPVLEKIAGEKLAPLNRVFDRGFKQNIKDRYQNAADLKSDILKVLTYVPPKKVEGSLKDSLAALETSQIAIDREHSRNQLEDVKRVLENGQRYIATNFKDFDCSGSTLHFDIGGANFSLYFHFRHKNFSEAWLEVNLNVETVGSEIVVMALEDSTEEELMRQDRQNLDLVSLEERVRKYFENKLAEAIDRVQR